jgi:hypothetical protein
VCVILLSLRYLNADMKQQRMKNFESKMTSSFLLANCPDVTIISEDNILGYSIEVSVLSPSPLPLFPKLIGINHSVILSSLLYVIFDMIVIYRECFFHLFSSHLISSHLF